MVPDAAAVRLRGGEVEAESGSTLGGGILDCKASGWEPGVSDVVGGGFTQSVREVVVAPCVGGWDKLAPLEIVATAIDLPSAIFRDGPLSCDVPDATGPLLASSRVP